jgi:hypothetical protein
LAPMGWARAARSQVRASATQVNLCIRFSSKSWILTRSTLTFASG